MHVYAPIFFVSKFLFGMTGSILIVLEALYRAKALCRIASRRM